MLPKSLFSPPALFPTTCEGWIGWLHSSTSSNWEGHTRTWDEGHLQCVPMEFSVLGRWEPSPDLPQVGDTVSTLREWIVHGHSISGLGKLEARGLCWLLAASALLWEQSFCFLSSSTGGEEPSLCKVWGWVGAKGWTAKLLWLQTSPCFQVQWGGLSWWEVKEVKVFRSTMNPHNSPWLIGFFPQPPHTFDLSKEAPGSLVHIGGLEGSSCRKGERSGTFQDVSSPSLIILELTPTPI